jgi:hypothetical protein
MNEDSENTPKRVSVSKSRIFSILALCIVLLFIVFAAFGVYDQFFRKPPKPSPPDLSLCTHLEIICNPSIIEYFKKFSLDSSFISNSDTKLLQPSEKIVIDNEKNIQTLAHAISSGSFKGFRKPFFMIPFSIIGYRNNERVICITNYGSDSIVTDKNQWFSYKSNLPDILLLVPKLRTLTLRMYCGLDVWLLYGDLFNFSEDFKGYPEPKNWCDIIIKEERALDISDGETKILLKCPSAAEGKCHYAMNPNCDPNSPSDMVLLFETKSGWNQHGGPELFTFDNHEPTRPAPDVLSRRDSGGGCVLLNNGSVKFIPTEEELNALRWK